MSEEQNQINLETGRIVFEIAKNEYDYEADRSKSVDSRASTFLSVSAAVFALVADAIKIPNNLSLALTITVYILIALMFLSLWLAIYFFARSLITRDFQRYDVANIANKNSMSKPPEKFLLSVSANLGYYVDYNVKVVEEKIDLYNKGVKSIQVSLIIIGVTMLFLIAVSSTTLLRVVQRLF